MSSVRMCDNCGTIFSELSDDWSTLAGSMQTTNKVTGKRETQSVEKDVCGDCNTMAQRGPKLVPQIEVAGLTRVDQ